MPQLYKDKIVEAFRDNAIKSVLLIDDEYLPYEKLAVDHAGVHKQLNDILDGIDPANSNALTNTISALQGVAATINSGFMSSGAASDFVTFFHKKKLVCDVENQTDNLDKNKIRKSDLIVLDYHLQQFGDNPAEKSLNLISELSTSKHMNMVVVYTAEPLANVWFEIAAALRGSYLEEPQGFFDNQDLFDSWQHNEDEWFEEWSLLLDRNLEASYLCGECNIDDLHSQLVSECEIKGIDEPSKKHVYWLLEWSIRKYNKNSKSRTSIEVHGKQKLWLQAGDVFVVLCSKECAGDDGYVRNTTAEEVWELVKTALVKWYPSFYRVVISELQNQIEDANLSMEKVLAKGKVEQIAALWGVLRVEPAKRSEAARELLDNLLSDVADKVQSSSKLLSFVEATANSVDENLPPFVSFEKDKVRYNNYLKAIVIPAHKNFNKDGDVVDADFRCEVLHAFNEQLSTEKELPDHISTGVVLKDILDSSYYLCIAPSCNTVPNQTTGLVAQRMDPHRPMRFIKLQNKTNTLAKCLKDAHQSDTIFISDGEIRLALSIFEQGTTPTIEQGVVVEHGTQLIAAQDSKAVQFFATNEEHKGLEVITKNLKLVAKLRPAFTSRYQNAQLQYEARIGVDLVSANMN